MKGWTKEYEHKGEFYDLKYRNTGSGIKSPVIYLFVRSHSLGEPKKGLVYMEKANGQSIAARVCKSIPEAIKAAENFMKRNPEFYKLG